MEKAALGIRFAALDLVRAGTARSVEAVATATLTTVEESAYPQQQAMSMPGARVPSSPELMRVEKIAPAVATTMPCGVGE